MPFLIKVQEGIEVLVDEDWSEAFSQMLIVANS